MAGREARKWTAEEIKEHFGREETGFSPSEADTLRIACNQKGVRFPAGNPGEMRRLWYQLVLKEPIPDEVLAQVGRQAKDPPAHPDAIDLARRLGIALSAVPGTGTAGVIGRQDVVEFAKRQAKAVEALVVAEEKPDLKAFDAERAAHAKELAERQEMQLRAEVEAQKAEIERLRAEKEKLHAEIAEKLVAPTPEPKPVKAKKAKEPETDIDFSKGV